MTRDEQQEAIAAAYRKLPLLPETTDDDLREHAASLLLGAGFMRMNRLPRANNSQAQGGARKEIEKLADLCYGLAKRIRGMHSDALRPLEKARCKPHPLMLVDTLKDVIRSACDALDSGEFPEPKKGPPEKRYERSTADHLLADYERFTGKRATVSTHPDTHPQTGKAYGHFLDLVSDVMPLLDIVSGFESQARGAIRRRKAKEKRSE